MEGQYFFGLYELKSLGSFFIFSSENLYERKWSIIVMGGFILGFFVFGNFLALPTKARILCLDSL
jgi:hypothetical protein